MTSLSLMVPETRSGAALDVLERAIREAKLTSSNLTPVELLSDLMIGQGQDAVAPKELCLTLQFRAQPDPGLVLEQALALLEPLGIAQAEFRPDWSLRLHPSRSIIERLSRTRRLSSWIDGEGVRFQFGPGSASVYYLDVTFASPPSVAIIDTWIPSLTRFETATFAYLVDPEWERWENETFAGHYELAKRSTQGLVLFRDPTLDQLMVDTSSHRGRRVARDHYTEMLGHEMWLLPPFWATAGADRSGLVRALPSRELAGGIVALTLSSEPFSDTNQPTEEIRRLLFP